MQIVTDSITKYVEGIRQAEILAFPGININQLVHKIETGRLILDKTIVLFHVGTSSCGHGTKAVIQNHKSINK